MSSSKIITIVGATGAQGKSVLTSFLADPSYTIRAVTRNPSSPSAQSLLSLSKDNKVSLVQADANDLNSLKSAFAGSHVIFAVTNFGELFMSNSLDGQKAKSLEAQQGINFALAAASTLDTLEHYVWSTLPDSHSISGGKNPVPHFDGKAAVDEHIRSSMPELLAKTTFLFVGMYSSVFAMPLFLPIFFKAANKYIHFGVSSPQTPVKMIGNIDKNLGPFVKAAVEQGDKTRQGAVVLAALPKWYTSEELLKIWADAKGVEAQYLRLGEEDYKALWGGWGEEIGSMLLYWDQVKERSWIRADAGGEKVLTAEDLGLGESDLEGLAESFKALPIA
ncbi:hypothetical protein QBC43DRAFT_319199 [Cladorrhinum sp. PSN259]|nr:hypothetical protein QBC43DRAFT_319199 [Cladorrhinum sp. PSN259]